MQDFELNRRFWNAVLFKARANLYVDASRTYLTVSWWVLEPLLLMGVYWLVFGSIFNLREPGFAAFLLVGLVPWQWLEKSISASAGSILDGVLVLQKVPINRLFFPVAIMLPDVAKTLLVFGLLLIILAASGDASAVHWLALLGVFVTNLLLVAVMGVWLALLTPFIPDLRVLVGIGLRVLMFGSGVFYPPSLLPEDVRQYFFWNPVALILDAYRNVLLRDQPAGWEALLLIAVSCTLLLALATVFSSRYGDRYLKRVL